MTGSFPQNERNWITSSRIWSSLSPDQIRESMARFTQMRLSPDLEHVDWVNAPVHFSEQLTAHLWATHQIDAFRSASIEYVQR